MAEVTLVTGEVYHVFSRSIAGFEIFNDDYDFLRAKEMIKFYREGKQPYSFSRFIRNKKENKPDITGIFDKLGCVNIICYCLMPTHIHIVLKQLKEKGISDFMKYILDSYSKYFNIKHKRKGPLWESRFKKVLVQTDEQLLHLTRYIHLNPATACLVNKPEKWEYSSYREYIYPDNIVNSICNYENILEIELGSYIKFTEDRISYQRSLASIKSLLLE